MPAKTKKLRCDSTKRPKLKGKTTINVASFFAGIGGFDLGFEKAGLKPVFHCEVDKFCNSVLRRQWPKILKSADIRETKAETIPPADVWCGGFPCQDVSVARGWLGRDGFKGVNSGLFYPFAKLIESRHPEVVILENVTGLLNSHGGKDFAILLRTFENLGYGVAWRILNTRYFGAPQSRPRVFICAWKNSADRAYRVLYEGGSCTPPEKPRLAFLRSSVCDRTGAIVPEIAFCLAATSGRHTGTDWSRSYVTYKSEVRRLTPTECERIQGYPENWTLPDKDFLSSKTDLDGLRYRAVGNAVSVPVVEWIGRRIASEINTPANEILSTDLFRSELGRFSSDTPEFGQSRSFKVSLPSITGHEDAPEIKWLSGGILENGECLTGSVPQLPNNPMPSLFVDALDPERPGDKYFLSSNAAKGILRRVNGQGRQLFEPLSKALEQLQKNV